MYSASKQHASNDHLTRSIPLRGNQSESVLSSKIPRRVLQQELSNERSYTRVPHAGKPKAQRAQMQGNVKLDLTSKYEEKIPRMAKLPMQGKTLQVAGADDSQIFGKKRSKGPKLAGFAEQSTKLSKNESKAALNWKILRKSRRSTLDTVAGKAVSQEVGPVQGLTHRSSVAKQSVAAAPDDQNGGPTKSNSAALAVEKQIEPQIISAITINDQIMAKGNQLSTRKNSRDEQQPKKTWIELEKEAMTKG